MGFVDNIQTLFGIQKKTTEATNNTPPKKVLIVEDDPSLAAALKDAFSEAGMTVVYAENGQIGLEMVKTENPHIVVLDLIMPVMNGTVMLKKLREIPEFKRLPVIVLTNAGQVENIKETVDYDNAMEFLIKSNVTLDEIVEKVKRIG